MSTVADSQDPGEHIRANDVFPVSKQSTAGFQQKDSNDGQHGVRAALNAQSSC
jgi:hypothetical protein